MWISNGSCADALGKQQSPASSRTVPRMCVVTRIAGCAARRSGTRALTDVAADGYDQGFEISDLHAMDNKRIHEILKDEFETAKQTMNLASQRFNEVVRDIPSGLPHPDGTQRIHNVGRELADAREKLAAAITRLNDFVSREVVPEDLRDLT